MANVRPSVPCAFAALPGLWLVLLTGCSEPVLIKTPEVADADDVATCKVAKDPLNPLIVEWPGTSKVQLDSTSKHGLVIVSYAGCTLKVLAGCTSKGTYRFTGVTPARDTLRVTSESELYARLPLGAASLKGELATGSSLDLNYVAVGERRAESAPGGLDGDCEGATHYVSRMTLGAYALDAVSSGSAGAGVDVQGAGVGAARRESMRRLRGSGEIGRCETSAPADEGQAFQTGCAAILQIGLAPLGASARGERSVMIEPAPTGEAPSRPPGARGSGTDRDGDGFADTVDRCPDEPEDKDGFQDEDGCPEPDNDADGVVDAKDACPNDPETKNGLDDADGCPEPSQAGATPTAGATAFAERIEIGEGVTLIEGTRFDLSRMIAFDSGKATLKSESLAVIERLAAFLLGQGKALRIEVSAHTDSTGADEFNLDLTSRRANEVKRLLVKAGVSAARIEAVGFGETKPIASNKTEAGRAQNRRVEIRVIKP